MLPMCHRVLGIHLNNQVKPLDEQWTLEHSLSYPMWSSLAWHLSVVGEGESKVLGLRRDKCSCKACKG